MVGISEDRSAAQSEDKPVDEPVAELDRSADEEETAASSKRSNHYQPIHARSGTRIYTSTATSR